MNYLSSLVRLGRFILPAALLIVGGACSGDSLSPFEPEVGNVSDNFQMQATNVANVTSTKNYSWVNTGTRATINHSTTTSAGSAVLVIKDGAGATVYSRTLSPSLNEATLAGPAGTWTIQLVLTGYSGTINYRVQKL